MLKLFVRVAGAAIAALIALVAGVYAAAADLDGLPDASQIASARFDNSPLGRERLVEQLDAYADSTGVRIVRVSSAPDNFLDERRAFQFGSDAAAPREIDWFSPTMHGSITSSADLGATTLNGVYALYATDVEAASFRSWAQEELGAEVAVTSKTSGALLEYALLTVGAWVPGAAALLLLVATILSWYVLRARFRELSILAGARTSMIVLTDLRSLLGALAVPALATILLAVAIVVTGGFGRIGFYVATIAWFGSALAALAVLVGLLTAVFTLPNLASIAARRPPERGSWMLSELLKATAVVLVAAIIPVATTLFAAASTAAALGATWSALGDTVTVRVGSAALEETENAAFGGLARSAVQQETAVFSMSLNSNSLRLVDEAGAAELGALGFDGVVIANRRYLEILSSRSGAARTVSAEALDDLSDLPSSVARLLVPTLELWTQSGTAPEVDLLHPATRMEFPVFGGMSGTFDTSLRPLILAVDDVGGFNDAFLASAISRGNLAFTAPDRVAEDVQSRGMTDLVLSIDRVADLGLYDSQSKQRNAQLGAMAVVLAMLALVLSVAVTACIFALLRRRRSFVQRTAGRGWAAILLPRMLWECVVAMAFSFALATAFAAVSPSALGFAIIAPAAYLTASWLIHRSAAATTFRSTLRRRG